MWEVTRRRTAYKTKHERGDDRGPFKCDRGEGKTKTYKAPGKVVNRRRPRYRGLFTWLCGDDRSRPGYPPSEHKQLDLKRNIWIVYLTIGERKETVYQR